MVLSSNWLKLQHDKESKSGNNVKQKGLKVNKMSKVGKKNSQSLVTSAGSRSTSISPFKRNPPRNGTKSGSKIMDMVADMNKEIEKVERDRKNGVRPYSEENLESSLQDKLKQDVGKKSSKRTTDVGKYIAMDCEFVGVGPEGKESALARVSIVNFYGNIVLDLYVKPKETVTDWRTWVSGIEPHHMTSAVTQEDCQKQVSDVLKGRILVGHSVHHDLKTLMLSHPRRMIRDTSRHMPFRQKYSEGKTPSLRKLTKEILGLEIQAGEHSSIEDARATMLLYKSDKLEFEKLHNKQFGAPLPS